MTQAPRTLRMHAIHAVRIGTHPEHTWRAYLANRSALYTLDARGPAARIRLKPAQRET